MSAGGARPLAEPPAPFGTRDAAAAALLVVVSVSTTETLASACACGWGTLATTPAMVDTPTSSVATSSPHTLVLPLLLLGRRAGATYVLPSAVWPATPPTRRPCASSTSRSCATDTRLALCR